MVQHDFDLSTDEVLRLLEKELGPLAQALKNKETSRNIQGSDAGGVVQHPPNVEHSGDSHLDLVNTGPPRTRSRDRGQLDGTNS